MSGKRLLAMLLCLVMLFSMLPTWALAEEQLSVEETPYTDETQEADTKVYDDPAEGALFETAEEPEPVEEVKEEPVEVEEPVQTEPDNPVISESNAPAEDVEPAAVPIYVVFSCNPADAVVTVYDSEKTDETGAPMVINPEEDGSWLLFPGQYLYDVSAEGFEAVEKNAFEVAFGADTSIQIDVTLNVLSDMPTAAEENPEQAEELNEDETAEETDEATVNVPEDEETEALLQLDADEATEGGSTGEVSRAEWVSALVAAFSMTVEADNYPDNYYSDISAEDSFYRDIMVAVEFGVIDLEAGLPFRPNDAATRDFAAETLVYCLGFQATEEVSYSYTDTVPHPWAAQVAIDRGWFTLTDGKFMPDQAITLAEKAGMLADAAEVLAGDVIDTEHDNNAGFADGVVIFPMGTYVEAPEEGSLTIYDKSIELKTGDFFVVYYETLPLVFKALSVSEGADCWVVSCTTDDTEDVIEEIDHEGILGTQMENFQPSAQSVYTTEDGVVVTEGETEFYVTPSATVIPESIPVKDLYVSKPIKLSNGLTATISASLTGVVLHDRIDTKNKNYEIYLSGDTHISTSVKGSLQEAIGSKRVELGKVPFLYGAGSLTLFFEYDLSGKIVLSWDGKMTAGFAYSGGSYRLIRSFQKTAFTITAEVTVQAGLGLSAGLNILVVKGEIWASIGARGKATMAIYDSGTPTRCSDFQAWMYASIGANASIKKLASWSWKEDIIKYSNSPVRVHYHFEDGALVGGCTRGQDFTDKTGSPPGTYYTDPDSNYFSPWGSDGSSSYEEVIIWTYDLDKDGIATITGFQGGTASLVVPETLDGYKVRAIGNGVFRGKTRLRTVVVSDGIESIGNSAFESCSNLRLIELPDSVTSIGNYAFAYTGLTQLTLPAKLRNIGACVLWNTKGVKELTIPKTVDSTSTEGRWIDLAPYGHIWSEVGPLSMSGITKLIFEDGTSTVPAHIGQKIPYLTEVVIPGSVNKIDSNAFESCVSLPTVSLPGSVTEIGDYVFNGCTAMTWINLPDSILSIGNYTFASNGLTSLTLPRNLQHIGFGILWNTKGVTELTIPKTVITTSEKSDWIDLEPYGHIWSQFGPLGLSFITKLSFEEGTTTVPAHIAQKAPFLTEVNIPNTVSKIDSAAFENCVALKEIKLSTSLTEIGDSVFSECTGISEIDLPDSLSKLGNYVFSRCGLTSLSLPKNLNHIGVGILWNTAGVTELTIPKTVNSTGEEGRWIDLDPYGHMWSSVGPLSLSFITKLTFEEGMTVIPSHIAKKAPYLKEAVLPNTVTKINYEVFENCVALEKVNLPDSLTEIGEGVFGECTALKEIALPDSLSVLGGFAFRHCGLTKLTLPKNLSSIGVGILWNTEGVTELTIPKTVSSTGQRSDWIDMEPYGHIYSEYGPLSLSYIEKLVFEDGTKTIVTRIAQKAPYLKEVQIPDSVTSLDYNAFEYCMSLETVKIPDSVTSISNGVFARTGLKTVSVPRSVTSMGEFVFGSCKSLQRAEILGPITTLKQSMFEDCSALEEVVLPNTIEQINSYAFQRCTALKTIDLKAPLRVINDAAFRECKALKEVTVPDTVEYLEADVFRDCDALTKAVILGDLKRMGTRVFYDCDALVDVHLGNGITDIPESTFEHCDVLESITLPYRVASIGANAFKDAIAFKSITIPRATTRIGDGAFSYPATLTIYGVSGTYAETYANENNIKFVNQEINATKVTLTPDQMTLYKGKSTALKMNVEPANFTDAVYFKSGNTSVATVDDNGLVKAVGTGTTTIKVTVGSASASCKVTVLQPVTSIYLNTSSTQMQAMETYQLTATVYPEDAADPSISWKSQNEQVATVDENGLVTAHTKGTATIVVSAKDGSGTTNRCRITVTNNGYIVDNIDKLESQHPYSDSCKDFWQYTLDGAAGLNVTFDAQTEIEDGFDYLHVFDGNGNELGKYTGTELAGKTVFVPGNTVRIQMNSDNGGNEWGFKVSSVEASAHATTYTVSYDANGGSGAPDNQTKTAGVALILSSEKPIRSGYQFAGWATSGTASAAEYQPGERYEMDSDLNLYAVWKEQHTHTPGNATRENEVEATCTAEGHYDEVIRCTVCGEIISSEAKTIPALGHNYVDGVCTRCGEKEATTTEFDDVSDPSAYYYEPVYWAASQGITSGTSPSTFSPGKDCTRGQIVTFLWKAMGSPEPTSTDNPFTDVKPGDYFYKPVLWAKENGVTSGTSATTFSPGKACTRGQIVTFLWKALGSPEPTDTSNPFTDVKTSDYFYKPVLWAKEKGVTSGTSATTFSPGKTCTRAQAMTFLYKATN